MSVLFNCLNTIVEILFGSLTVMSLNNFELVIDVKGHRNVLKGSYRSSPSTRVSWQMLTGGGPSLANHTISAQRSPPTPENLKQCAMTRGSLISNLKIMSLISIGKWAKVLPDEEARADKAKGVLGLNNATSPGLKCLHKRSSNHLQSLCPPGGYCPGSG